MSKSLENSENYWFARHSKSIIFSILILAAIGIYEALSLPVAVFPTTNFPRIIIGVENGVMPIEQMEVAVTRPLEQAVNGVPGLQQVRSVTSRGSAEINLFFDWNVNMVETLQYVDAAVSRAQSSVPSTVQIETAATTRRGRSSSRTGMRKPRRISASFRRFPSAGPTSAKRPAGTSSSPASNDTVSSHSSSILSRPMFASSARASIRTS